jgi:hypothetical protein
MLLFVLLLIIVAAGLAAIELGQAARPRGFTVWNDDIERRMLRDQFGSRGWW